MRAALAALLLALAAAAIWAVWGAGGSDPVAERRAAVAQAVAAGAPAEELALARLLLADALNETGQAAAHAEAAGLAEQALAALDESGRGESDAAAVAAYHHGLALHRSQRTAEARAPALRAADALYNLRGLGDAGTAAALDLLTEVLKALHEEAEAIKARSLLVDARVQQLGRGAPLTLATAQGLGGSLLVQARYRELLALARRILADDPPPAGPAFEPFNGLLNLQMEALRGLERKAEALGLAETVHAQRVAAWGADDPRTLQAQARVAEMLGEAGRHPEALRTLQAVHERLRATQGEDELTTVVVAAAVGRQLHALERYDEAWRARQALAASAAAKYGEQDDLTLSLRKDEAQSLLALGRYGEAVQLLRDTVGVSLKRHGEAHPLSIELVDAWVAAADRLGLHDMALNAAQLVAKSTTALLGDQHSRALAARIDLARLEAKAGRSREALAALQPLEQQLAHSDHAAHALLPMLLSVQAECLRRLGRSAEARQRLLRALPLAEALAGEDSTQMADLLIDLGALQQASPGEQLQTYARALRSAQASGAPEFVWRAHAGLMAAHAALRQSALATLHGKQAINSVQTMRAQLRGVAESAQQSFLADKRVLYERTSSLLLAEGRLPEAQQVLGLLKEQEFSDFIHRGGAEAAGQPLVLNSAEAKWKQQLDVAGEHLVTQARAKAVLDAKLRSEELTPQEQQRHAELLAALKTAREAFDGALRDIAAASAAQPQRLGHEVIDSVRAMRSDLKALGHGAVLLHYLPGPEKLWILLTTPEVQIAREVKVGSAELNQRIDALRQALRSPSGQVLAPARALHQLLLAPVAADLSAAQARTLMLSLDGALRYVPFAALHDGQRYAVEQYRMALFTEAARSKIKDRPLPQWSLTGLGLTRAVAGFSALPAVREELVGLTQVMPGETVLDEAFTAKRLRALLSEPKPVLHIASHFKFTPGTEADSYLLLGDGGRLTLQQIRQEDLLFEVDLLTLSACETAVGDNARGAEVEGLGALAQKQGAKAVLATLWPVADASTGVFMREVYRRRAELKLTKAEAIRQVQVDFLQGKIVGGDGPERGARVQGSPGAPPASVGSTATGWAHPFYWAPFILMGNWL